MPDLPIFWNYWEYDDDSFLDPVVFPKRSSTTERLQVFETRERMKEAAVRDREQFHDGHFRADFSAWKRAYWTAEQAAALAFGKNPELITPDYVEESVGPSIFAEYYDSVLQKIEDAQAAATLPDPIRPRIFLEWAKREGIDLPPGLDLAVPQEDDNVEDFRSLYTNVAAENRALRAKLHDAVSEIDRLHSVKSPEPEPDQDLKPKERISLLKLVLGIATKKYGFGSKPGKMGIPKQIAGELLTVGIRLDEDTVRKWLTRASEEVDVDPNGTP